MLSIVVCARKGGISDKFTKNINETIGCEFEFIVIDNSTNAYSIFEAYNLGIAKSQFEYLVFLHDDLIIHTKNWGKIIFSIFMSNPDAGLLGIAGSKIKTKMPSAWWENKGETINIIQHNKDGTIEHWNRGFNDKKIVEVAAIDGVFMATRKNENMRFDERLPGFHNYDLNLSILTLIEGKKVLVTNRILIEHLSIGSQDRLWYESTGKFHKLYKEHLPLVKGNAIQKKELKEREFELGYRFVEGLIRHKLYKDALYWWFQTVHLKPNSIRHLRFLKKMILSKE